MDQYWHLPWLALLQLTGLHNIWLQRRVYLPTAPIRGHWWSDLTTLMHRGFGCYSLLQIELVLVVDLWFAFSQIKSKWGHLAIIALDPLMEDHSRQKESRKSLKAEFLFRVRTGLRVYRVDFSFWARPWSGKGRWASSKEFDFSLLTFDFGRDLDQKKEGDGAKWRIWARSSDASLSLSVSHNISQYLCYTSISSLFPHNISQYEHDWKIQVTIRPLA